jgi:predicted PurR-regulated permease PerM
MWASLRNLPIQATIILMDNNRPVWSTQTKLVVTAVLLVIVAYLLYRFSIIIPHLIIAVILAYALSPLVNFLHHRLQIRRILAILLTYLLLLVSIAAVLNGIIPMLLAQVRRFNLDTERLLFQAQHLIGQRYYVAGVTIDVRSLLEQLNVSLQDAFSPIFGSTISLVGDVLAALVWLVFTIVISIYLIKDSESLRNWIVHLPPPPYQQDFMHLWDEVNLVWAAFFRGQLILATMVTFLFALMGFIIGLPLTLFMAVLAGAMEFLPTIGHTIWLLIAVTLAMVRGSTWLPLPNWLFALIIVALDVTYAQFDLNYLIPRIVGRRVHLSPLVVILGIIAGASILGVLGVLLAAPTIASLRVLGRYIYARLVDGDPFPQPAISDAQPPPNPRWWLVRRKKVEHPFE